MQRDDSLENALRTYYQAFQLYIETARSVRGQGYSGDLENNELIDRALWDLMVRAGEMEEVAARDLQITIPLWTEVGPYDIERLRQEDPLGVDDDFPTTLMAMLEFTLGVTSKADVSMLPEVLDNRGKTIVSELATSGYTIHHWRTEVGEPGDFDEDS